MSLTNDIDNQKIQFLAYKNKCLKYHKVYDKLGFAVFFCLLIFWFFVNGIDDYTNISELNVLNILIAITFISLFVFYHADISKIKHITFDIDSLLFKNDLMKSLAEDTNKEDKVRDVLLAIESEFSAFHNYIQNIIMPLNVTFASFFVFNLTLYLIQGS